MVYEKPNNNSMDDNKGDSWIYQWMTCETEYVIVTSCVFSWNLLRNMLKLSMLTSYNLFVMYMNRVCHSKFILNTSFNFQNYFPILFPQNIHKSYFAIWQTFASPNGKSTTPKYIHCHPPSLAYCFTIDSKQTHILIELNI